MSSRVHSADADAISGCAGGGWVNGTLRRACERVTIASTEPLAMGTMGSEGTGIRLRKMDSTVLNQALAPTSAVRLPRNMALG